jgi:hypothetical protein
VAKNIAIVLRNMCTRSSPDASAVEGVLYTWEAIVQHGADLPMEVSARARSTGPLRMPHSPNTFRDTPVVGTAGQRETHSSLFSNNTGGQ